jgi:isocitrate dehydrogenase (NAD+)
VRPCKTYPGVRSRYEGVDIVIVRENTEDLYAGVEFERGSEWVPKLSALTEASGQGPIREDAGVSLKTISEFGTRRIVTYAFEYARKHGRKSVVAVHKANIMKFSDGLFLAVAREIAKQYPDIEFWDVIVDNLCMQLVQRPEQFDVLVLPNLYGDIISDLCAGLVGGLGVAPGANIGDDTSLFEPTHGSAPKYAGQNKVNPLAQILSGMLMLRHLGELGAADRLERAITELIREGDSLTYDMKPTRDDPTAVGTSEVADALIQRMDVLARA